MHFRSDRWGGFCMVFDCIFPKMTDGVSSIIEEDEESGRYLYIRGRPLRATGKCRNRYESSEDHIPIDYSKPLQENIRDALVNSVNSGNEESVASKQVRLNYLNNLVRLIEKSCKNTSGRHESIRRRNFKEFISENGSPTSITYEEIMMCMRCLLTDDEREIRAAALRTMRYLIQSDEDLKIALRLHIDILIARSLDLVLDNRLERTQCIRLLISLIHHCPSTFPPSLVQLLLAISLDGQEENDKLARAATAALCELVVLNCDLVLACGGLTWLIRAILMSGQSSSRLAECLTTVLDLMAPLMDEYFKLSGMEKEEKAVVLKAETEQVLENCRAALVAALRTWPGLIGCFSSMSSHTTSGNFLHSPIYALVASLSLDSDKIRDFAVEAICEILNFPYQNEHWDTWEKTLEMADCVPLEEYKYSLSQHFVNADAMTMLEDWNRKWRPNLTTQTLSLILLGLVDSGLINALSRAIVRNPNRALELKMTLVLSDLLDLCGRYLPLVYRHLTLSLSSVLQSVYNELPGYNETGERTKRTLGVPHADVVMPPEVRRQNGILLAYRLRALSNLRQRPRKIRTLQMENLLSKFYYARTHPIDTVDGDMMSIPILEKTIPRVHTLRSMNQAQVGRTVSLPADAKSPPSNATVDRVHELVRDSRTMVPYSNYTAWDWSLIYLALCQITEHRQHLDDSTCAKFTNQLVQFFDPIGGQFCKIAEDYRFFSRVGCALIKVLGSASWDSPMGVQLRTFLAHLVSNLLPDRLHVGQLSTKNILNGSCGDYFTFIGQLSDTEYGRLALERTGVVQRLVDLINCDSHDVYIKLIVSSMLDYDLPGIGRILLQKALTSSRESAGLYSTSFLLTLGKLKVADFGDWGMEMIINQLRDNSRNVVEESARVLEELINDEEYSNSLVHLRPSLLPLGDAGIILLTCVMSHEHAVSAMITQQAPTPQKRCSPDEGHVTEKTVRPAAVHNFVGNEIERWKSTFNMKYARILDERLCEAFTSYKRMADGSFPRHASRSSQTMADVYVPLHLYGQLAKHTTGCQLLQKHGCLPPLLDILHNRVLSNESDVLSIKSALWALGHVASTELGHSLLPKTLVASFVKIAEECPILTVRGCAFHILNLVAQSCSSARNRLRQLGWEASTPTPSLSTFCRQQKRHSKVLLPADQDIHSRRFPVEENCSNLANFENSTDDNPGLTMLSASVTSAGVLSSSGSSPPRIPSPSIFLISPDASRKSSEVPQVSHRFRSQNSSGDAHSIVTCGSCELCRGPLTGWTNSGSGAAQSDVASSIFSFGNVVSPVRVQCCELPSPEICNNFAIGDQVERRDSSASQDRRNTRSKSLGTVEPTGAGVQSSLLVPATSKRERTPSPKNSPNDRKSSVPTAMVASCGHSSLRSRMSDHAASCSILEETAAEVDSDQFSPALGGLAKQAKIVNEGFFTRLQKKSDVASEHVRLAVGLKKIPMLPEDLPVVRGSLSRELERKVGRSSEYITDENASGIMVWRQLQKQQRQYVSNLDADIVLSADVVAVSPDPGVGDTISVSVGEEQSQSTLDTSFQGDQSPSLQRQRFRPIGDSDWNTLDGFGLDRPVFMCLPLDIGLICNITDWPSCTRPNIAIPAAKQDIPASFYPARDHVTDCCLHCHPLVSEEILITRQPEDISESIDSDKFNNQKQQHLTSDSTFSDQQKSLGQTSAQATAFRKELLRLVTLLCVRKKYAEQGLLRLKQEAPQLFRSLCVYSDVSYILSTYTFRLAARRFLQELFQDVDFRELWTEPKRFLLLDCQNHLGSLEH